MDGEGLTDVYVARAEVMAVLIDGRRLPLAIFYDDACALKSFARNAERASLSPVAKSLADMKYLLDIWHRWNHLRASGSCLHDAEVAREIDPYLKNNKQIARKYNTEACEQVFA